MHSSQPPALLIVLYLALLARRGDSQCSLITDSEVQSVLTSALTELSSEGGPDTGTVQEWNANCLAAASMRGYAQTTVTMKYLLPMFGYSDVAEVTVNCDVATSVWMTQIDTSTQFVQQASPFFGGGTATAEELLAAETNMSCVNCQFFLSDVNTPNFCVGEYT